MIRVISLNLNGIRSAGRKGFAEWLAQQQADVVCVQELKARDADIVDELRNIDGLTGHFHCAFMVHMEQLVASGREIIICGDWNIAHQQIDLKNWRSNQKNSGFLPAEREWLTEVFDRVGCVDVFRRLDQRAEQYTWWSNRGQAWAKNVGWRLDYQIATPGIASKAKSTSIYTEARFSDHAPLTIDYGVRR